MVKKLLSILFFLAYLAPIKAQLVSSFIASDTAGCPPLIVDFTNDTSSGNPTWWHWDFGNGNISNLYEPVESFTNPGIYNVTVTVSNNTDTVYQSISIHVYPVPTAGFTTSDTFAQCPPFPVRFAQFLMDTLSAWDFGDGNVVGGINPYHIYIFPGSYSVTHVQRNEYGCQSDTTIPDLILVKGPIGHFNDSPDSGCPPLAVTFSGTVQDVYESNFITGDGSVWNDTIDLTYTYRDSGLFLPVYTLTDSFECRVAYTLDSIHVFNCDSVENGLSNEQQKPEFSFQPNPASDFIDVSITGKGGYDVVLLNVTGQLVRKVYGSGLERVNVHDLPNGVYILKVEDLDLNLFSVEKVIIQH